MKTTERFEKVNIEMLVPYARNARTHSDEQIAQLRASIREFGFVNPVLIDKDFGIIAGHGRVIAARLEGLQEVPCVFVDYLTEAQKRAYIIADNKLAEKAGWDEDLLKIELGDLSDMSFDLTIIGFDESEINSLLSFNDGEPEVHEDDFETELPEEPITKLGDLWLLGRHRLVCGDSTKPETFNLLMDGKKANLVVTDPPYNVAYEGSAGKILNDNMENEAFYTFLLSAFTNTEAVMAQDASVYIFHADTEGLNFRKAFADAGFYLSGTCIWKKQSLVLGRSPYQWQHEPVLFGWKKTGKHLWYSDRKQTTIWEFDKPRKNSDHPTMKPVALVAYPIINSSLSNCIVLDPFGGSGSTLIACEQTERICYTIELDPKYCDVIIARFYQNFPESVIKRNGVTIDPEKEFRKL